MDTKIGDIHVKHDDDAMVWVATSDDIKGLALSDPNLSNLHEKLQSVVPELLKANQQQNIQGYRLIVDEGKTYPRVAMGPEGVP